MTSTLIDPQNDSLLRRLTVVSHDEDIGARVDDFLAKNFPFLTRSKWQKRIDDGELMVGGRKVKSSYRLRHLDPLDFLHRVHKEPAVNSDVAPFWKRGKLMAFYKPPNLPMHENGPYKRNTFNHIVKSTFGDKWSFVHRLDKETSGIVICGSDPAVRRSISKAWQRGEVRKEYLAICRGEAPEDFWIEEGPIGNLVDSPIRIKKWVVEGGLPCETHFHVLERKEDYTLVKAEPKTGRTNQIRIHLAFRGLPIVGDKLYHDDENVFLEYWEKGSTENVIEQAGHFRLALHASRLSFVHPETKETCYLGYDLPEDLVQLWDSL
jgi:RluA family pseudouridine synthase